MGTSWGPMHLGRTNYAESDVSSVKNNHLHIVSCKGVYFVTRLKDNAAFLVVENRAIPAGTNVRRDQVVYFHSQAVPDREHFSGSLKSGTRKSRGRSRS